MNDKEVREAIINQSGNIVVSASAGSGKTSIMVKKIEHELKNNKKHFTIGATTFTNKATAEIQSRLKQMNLGSVINKCFVGTNDSFAMDEIIKPFFKDVFKLDTNIEVDYNEKIFTYEEGVKLIKDKGKLGIYDENTRNFKFELALKILKDSLAARRYLKSKYFKLFIDEYQDCDVDMHNMYMYMYKSLGIELFIVGDVKQSIYTWRGANPRFLNEVNKNCDFEKFKLNVNFRSTEEIQNYTNLFLKENLDMYDILEDNHSVIFISNDYLKDIFNVLDISKSISFIVKTNNYAGELCKILNELENSPKDFAYIPKTPLSKISSPSIWIGELVANIVLNKSYSEYRLKNDIPIDIDIKYLKKIFKNIKGYKNIDELIDDVKELYNTLNYDLNNDEKDAIITTISNEYYSIAYEESSFNHVVTTIHSVKGLEYDEVIIFADNYNLNQNNDKSNHYVSITRAKEKIIVVYNKDSRESKNYISYVKNRIKDKKLSKKEVSRYITTYSK